MKQPDTQEKHSNMKPFKVALIGLGTIGTGVAKILLEDSERIAVACGRKVELVKICDKDITTKRGIEIPAGILTDNLAEIYEDKEIELAIELIGGLEPARTIVLKLLESGKNVVSANKALLASHGTELFQTADRLHRTIAFEAAVCGGIPILNILSSSLQGNRIESIHAIVNGTSNFILSQMAEKKTGYDDAVKEAQARGYAEANPAMDVDGTDAVQKLVILSQLAFGATIDWEEIPRIGIESIQPVDIKHAHELGYRIRLLAVAEAEGNELELHVSPTLVRKNTVLGETRDVYNGLQLRGSAVGSLFFQGMGAGQMATASAVLGDVIDTLLGRTAITFHALRYWCGDEGKFTLKKRENIIGRSYVRCLVQDRPGVMGELARIFGENDISLASIIQHGRKDEANDSLVPIIFITHAARECDILNAVDAINRLPYIDGNAVRMRIRD